MNLTAAVLLVLAAVLTVSGITLMSLPAALVASGVIAGVAGVAALDVRRDGGRL